MIYNTINKFSPISLSEINEVSLMNRVDTKYLVRKDVLRKILNEIEKDYYVLEINGERLMEYKSVYYDTGADRFYLTHHNGKLNRVKIRKRLYVNTNTCFLEVKFKNNKGKTIKERIGSLLDPEDMLLEADIEFLKDKINGDFNRLRAKMSNNFMRITLVSKKMDERCTIDLDLGFANNGSKKNIQDLVIIEIKREGNNRNSKIEKCLKSYRIKRTGFSKYCMGRCIMEKDLKQNAFKVKLRKVNKLIKVKN